MSKPSQRYCKKPFEPGEVGSLWGGHVRIMYFEDVQALTSCNFTACGVWAGSEISTDPHLSYYICKRCLQHDGLVW